MASSGGRARCGQSSNPAKPGAVDCAGLINSPDLGDAGSR